MRGIKCRKPSKAPQHWGDGDGANEWDDQLVASALHDNVDAVGEWDVVNRENYAHFGKREHVLRMVSHTAKLTFSLEATHLTQTYLFLHMFIYTRIFMRAHRCI